MKGGYQIIDLKDTALIVGGEAVTIEGLYEKIEGNYRKPILLEGLLIGGIERPARFVTFGIVDSTFVAAISISNVSDVLSLTVTDEDEVTLANQ